MELNNDPNVNHQKWNKVNNRQIGDFRSFCLPKLEKIWNVSTFVETMPFDYIFQTFLIGIKYFQRISKTWNFAGRTHRKLLKMRILAPCFSLEKSKKHLIVCCLSGAEASVSRSPTASTSAAEQHSQPRRTPGTVHRVLPSASDARGQVLCGVKVPFCNVQQASLSFHGFRDLVKFFLCLPGSHSPRLTGADLPATATGSRTSLPLEPENLLILSGGQGYVDFRYGIDEFMLLSYHIFSTP